MGLPASAPAKSLPHRARVGGSPTPVSTTVTPAPSSISQRLMWSRAKGSGMRTHWMPGATAVAVPPAGGSAQGWTRPVVSAARGWVSGSEVTRPTCHQTGAPTLVVTGAVLALADVRDALEELIRHGPASWQRRRRPRLDPPGGAAYTTWAMPPLPVGKVRAETLRRLFARYVPKGERVVVGPRVGEDAAVLDMGDCYLVATTDPITFATGEMGRYAVHVNATDLAARGALPRWFLATLLLPEGQTTESSVEGLFAEIAEACGEVGVALVGGHTEITAGLDRPIVVGAMLGEVAKDRLVTTAGARPGDRVLLTKGVPLEGAAIIARERGDEAERRGVPREVVARAREFLRRPGISVLPEARAACGAAGVHAMHDPTEGGLATACWELAQAGAVGVRIA